MKKIWPVIFIVMFLWIHSSYAAEVVYYYEDDPYAETTDNDSVVEYYDDEEPEQVAPSVSKYYTRKHVAESVSSEDDAIVSTFSSRLSPYIQTSEKVIVVNPHRHVWGAYSKEGRLIHAGLATSGSTWCADLGRSCRTRVGTFRIGSLGARNCISSRYPLGRGGAPMPYCMYFNGNQGIHGSYEVSEGNRSHGCVRVRVQDAEWIRFHFANIGTKVIIMNY